MLFSCVLNTSSLNCNFPFFLFSLLCVVTSTGYLEIDTTFMFFLACLFKSSRVSCELEENKFLRRGKEPIEWYLTTSYWSNSCCRGFRLFFFFVWSVGMAKCNLWNNSCSNLYEKRGNVNCVCVCNVILEYRLRLFCGKNGF